MARSGLRLSDNDFWDMMPKTLFAMIAEYLDMIDYKAMIYALANNGQPLPPRVRPHDEREPEQGYAHVDSF
jgi:hypothetical protein